MTDPNQLFDIWHQIPRRPNEKLPRRQDIRAAQIARFLPFCWQFQQTEGNDFVITFKGEQLVDLWGRDTTGTSFFKALEAIETVRQRQILPLLLEIPCGATSRRLLPKGEGGAYYLNNWVVPLADTDGKPTILFGISQFSRHQQETPYSGKLQFANDTMEDGAFIDLGFGVPGNRRTPA